MIRPREVRARQGNRLWPRYDDGVESGVDLPDLAGRGVFAAWRDRGSFEAVAIDEAGAIAWGGNIELCPDAVYLRLTGEAPGDIYPR